MRLGKVWRLIGAFALSAALIAGCGGSTGSSGSGSSAESSKDNAAETETAAESTAEESAETEETEESAAETADTTETAQSNTPADTIASEEAPDAQLKASAQLDCSFVLEGKSYTLPFDFSELLADGWTTYVDVENEDMGALTYTWLDLSKEGVDDELTFYVFNGTGNSMKLSECQVVGIEVYDRNLSSYSFALSNGIKPGDEYDQVIALMGTPAAEESRDDLDTISYGEGRESGRITFVWGKGDYIYSSIEVQLFQRQETETSSEVPDYLSEYKAPTEMGADFDSGTISLDGKLYQLSCPISEFLDDGWTIEKDKPVAAGRYENIYMKKNDIEISAYVRNLADYQTYGSNCVVYELNLDGYSDPVPDVIIPHGISFKTDLNTLDSAVNASALSFDRDEDDSRVFYYYSNYETHVTVSFYYNKDKQSITSISVERDMWP